jgi:hypothetical protein
VGESRSLVPAYSWPLAEFADPSALCEFRAGLRLSGPGGRALVRVRTLTVLPESVA